MKILAFDTAAAACSVALWVDGALLARRFEPMERGHAEALVPMIEGVMAEARVPFRALDGLAVTVGPGTFTGLRVGLACARGLALALGRPIAPVGTLEALAEASAPEERAGRSVVAALDARRGAVYWQVFGADLAPSGPPRIGPALSLRSPGGPLLLVGSGAGLVRGALAAQERNIVLSSASDQPDAARVAALAARRFSSARPGQEIAPLYLREACATPAPGAA